MRKERKGKWRHISELHFRTGDEYDKNVMLNSPLEDLYFISKYFK